MEITKIVSIFTANFYISTFIIHPRRIDGTEKGREARRPYFTFRVLFDPGISENFKPYQIIYVIGMVKIYGGDELFSNYRLS